MNGTVHFWFAIGSTYTYLSVMRIAEIAERRGINFVWHPFNVREIMLESNNLPFPDSKPAKQAYMWRDLERRAESREIPMCLPVEYPLAEFERANRIAVLAELEGWCEAYTTAAYAAWFQDGLPAGSDANLARVLPQIDQSQSRVVSRANEDDVADLLTGNTERARQLGIFGAPSFVVDGELFWGDDRLEDAVSWSQQPAAPA